MFGKNRNGNNGNGVGVVEGDEELFPANINVTDPDEEVRDDAKAKGKKADGGGKKRRTGALAGLVFILGFGVLAFLYLTGGLSNRRVAQATVNAPAAMQREVSGRQVTDQQINQFEQSLRAGQSTLPPMGTPVTGAIQPVAPVSPQMGTQPGLDPATLPVTSLPVPGASPVVPTAGAAGTVQPGQQAAENGGEVRTSAPSQSASAPAPAPEPQEAAQSSRYFYQDEAPATARALAGGGEAPRRGDDAAVEPATSPATRARASAPAPVVPPFGTFLRLRTLGSINTLRRDGIVRFELTRPARGDGWFLPRGTRFVGRKSGADADRAFVNVFGYFDPASKQLVSVGGEVNSGNGIKGERKTVGSRWLRALQHGGDRAFQLFSSLLAGRGGGTQVIVPNGVGIPGANGGGQPVAFVMVKAGVEVSLMLSDLPAPVRGVTPEAVPGGDGLTDDEMMELITSDDPEQIMAALPRMSAEQRQLAEYALKEN